MAISLQADSTLPQGYILVDGQRAATVTTAGLSGLVPQLQQALMPVGAVQSFARTSAPVGWLICNGDVIGTTGTVQGIAVSDLTALRNMFLSDSNPFGVSGGNPLLPDLRGYFVRGSGTNSDGTAAGTFGGKQADELKQHDHPYSLAVNSNNYSHNGGAGALRTLNTSAQTGLTGGTETRPKNIALLYCIKY